MTENPSAAVPSEPTTPADEIAQQPQRQDALNDQLMDLRKVANRLGMYDAADFILNRVARARESRVEVGPSPEQIDALLQQAMDEEGSEGFLAIVTSDANGNNDWFPADDVIARFFELLVAACSVRGAE